MPPGAAEIPLGTNLQVPLNQRGATALNGRGLRINSLLANGPDLATLSVCNFDLH